ncbi:T9SS type B sorting domain-containing protein [Saccharicrinis fermentans]|uniref:T9SS type B sorting domain-containing protein n=1 Tax=Saccharicrinis fermentans TaxID=982 RepID=UPI0012683061|nr:gliding motility-associated C-terminal domain-containing protein [Saccharicrinis fermentans]
MESKYFGKRIYFDYYIYDSGYTPLVVGSDYTFVYQTPTLFDLTTVDSSICPGESVVLKLEDSESGIDYQLKDSDDNDIGFLINGSASEIEFTVSPSVSTSYYVAAVNSLNNSCYKKMNGDILVTVNDNPVITSSSSDPEICLGNSSTLSATTDMDPDVDYIWDDGAGNTHSGSTWTVTPISTTTYTVTATNRNTGCSSKNTETITVNTNPTITASGNSPVCEGSNISLTSAASGGSGSYSSYSWTGPNSYTASSQNAIITGATSLQAGDYFVTVTDDNGCSSDATDFTTVVVNERPTVLVSYNAPVCNGTNLVLTASPSGGSGTYTSYIWTKNSVEIVGETGATLTISSTTASDAGTYGVKVEDAAGCISDEQTVTVTIHSLPVPTAGNDGPVCEGGTIQLTGGPNGISYAWTGPNSFSSTVQNPVVNNITLADAGTYTLTVTDGNSCEASVTTDVVVNANPTITASSNSPVCEGSNISLTSAASGGSGSYSSYNWSGPNSYTASSQNAIITGATSLQAGDYFVTVTDDNGCSSDATDFTTVVVNERPTVLVSYNAPVCNGTNLVLTASASGGSGSYASYIWTKNSVEIVGETGATLTISSTTASDAATYGVKVEDAAGCISDEQTVTVTIHSLPVPTAGNDGPVCEGETINLTGGPNGISYAWTGPNSFSSTVQNPVVNNITLADAGTYTLTVTDGNSCEASVTTDVVVNTNPTITASSNSPVCEGSNISLTSAASGGSGSYSSYSWTGPNSYTASSQNAIITGATSLQAGDYFVTVTDDNGCSSDATTFTSVIVNERPTVSVSYNAPVCNGTNLVLTASASGGSGSYASYIWTKNNVEIVGETGATLTISSTTASDAATYGVKVEDAAGCISDEQTVIVTIHSLPVPTAGNDGPVCEGGTINLTGGPNGISYAWSGPNSFSSTDQNPIVNNITLADAGTYTLTVTDGNSCEASVTTDVVVNANPTITVSSNSPVCEGSNISLTSAASGGSGSYSSYSWTGPNSYTASSQNAIITGATSLQAGDYFVTVTDDNGCSSDATVFTTVSVNERPTVSLAYNSPVCLNTTLELTATASGGTGNYVNYIWTKDGSPIVGENASVLTIDPAAISDAGSYGVIVEDDAGCSSDEQSVAVTIHSLPVPTAGNDGPVCEGGTIQLSGGPNGISYAWTGPNSFSSADQNPVINNITLADAGTYTLTVTDGNSCEASVTTDVDVNANPTIIASSNTPVCEGSNISLTSAASGGSGSYSSYSWTGPNSYTAGSQNAIITGATSLQAGDYFVTVTDDNGCSSDATAFTTVAVNERPTVSLAYNSPVCLNTTLVLTATASGGTNNYVNYIWTKDGSVIVGENSSTLTIDPAAVSDAGSYGVTVEDDAGCSSDETTLAVSISALPVVTASNDGPVCVGEDVTLSASVSGTVSYNWSGPNSFSNVSKDPVINSVTLSDAGTFTVEVTDGNGCVGSASTDVIVNDLSSAISVSAPSPGLTTICARDTVSFNASGSDGSGSYTYDFHLVRGASDSSEQNNSTNVFTTSSLQDGDKVYVVVNDVINGCTHTSGAIEMTVISNPIPTLSITSSGGSTICSGETVDFLATPGTFSRYVFMRNGTDTLQDGTSNLLSINTLNDGDEITVVAYAGSCFGTSTATKIQVNPLPTSDLVADKTTVCQNEVVTFTATAGGTGPFQYQFYIDGVAQGVQGTNTFTHSASSDFSVEAEVFDGNNCSVLSAPVDINISIPVAGLIADKTSICAGEEVTFTATGGVSYEFFVDGVSVQGPDVNDVYILSTILDNDNDNVTVTVTNATGCTASHAGIKLTVNPIPTVSISSSDADNTICAGDEVIFTASGGDVFEWFVDGVSVQGPDANNQYVTTSLNDGEKVSALVSYSSSSCGSLTSEIITTVHPLPVPILNVSPSSTVISGTMLTFTASGGDEYTFFVNGTVVQARSTNNVYQTDLLVDGDVVSIDAYNSFDCYTSLNTTVTVLDGIEKKDVKVIDDRIDYCAGDGGSSVYVDDPQDGITYELVRTSDDGLEGSAITYSSISPVAVQWDDVLGTDEYRVEAYYASVPAEREAMNNRVTITSHPLPTAFSLSSPSASPATGCNGGAGHDIDLSGSQLDFIYRLLVNGIEEDQMIGTGAAISFKGNNVVGLYTIEAEDNVSGCTRLMNGAFEIKSDGSDVTFNLEVVDPADSSDPTDGRYCMGGSGVELQLDGSLDNSVSYILFLDGVDTGISVPGADGAAISFGTVTAEGTYTVRVASSSGCQFPMDGQANVSIVDLPQSFSIITDNALDPTSGHYCAGESGVYISVDGQEDGIAYTLLHDGLEVETLTGASTPALPLTFSGPLSTEGTYTVEARVPQVGCSISMDNPIEVVIDALPSVFDAYNDNDTYCAGESTSIYILDSEADVEYWWEDNLGNTGVAQKGNNSKLEFTITASGEYNIMARRTDGITGCSSVMKNGPFVITENPLPVDVALKLADAGTGCDHGDSLYVEGPEVGVEYILVKKVGTDYYPAIDISSVVSTDGTDVGFDRIVDTGAIYSIQAIKNGCSIYASSEVAVNVPGAIAKQKVTGSGEICNGDPGVAFGLEDTELGVNYELWKAGDATALETIAGTGSTISFTEVIDEGEYYVMAVNGLCDMEMANRVQLNVNPLPLAYSMFGSGITCDLSGGGALLGLVGSEEDFTYRLQFDNGGGVLSVETIIPGRSDSDSLKYVVNTEGTYSFIAISDKGCTSNMNGSITVVEESEPLEQTIVPLATNKYCSGSGGIELQLENNELDVIYQVRDESNNVVSQVHGTNTDTSVPQVLPFPDLLKAGSYTIWKLREGDACVAQTNNNEVIVLEEELEPSNYNVLADVYTVCENTEVTISLDGFDPGVSYRLESDSEGAILDTITDADRGSIYWKVNQTGIEIYEVIAMSESGGCDNPMGSVMIEFKDAPDDPSYVLSGDSFCEGEDGVTVGIKNTESDVEYFIMRSDDSSLGLYIKGDGSDIDFVNKITEGEYYIIARNGDTGCEALSTDMFTITINENPEVFDLELEDGLDCTTLCYGLVDTDELILSSSVNTDVYSLLLDETVITPDAVDIAGTGNMLNFGTRSDEGSYSVVATSAEGCSVKMNGTVILEQSPLEAVDDYLNLNGTNTGVVLVPGLDYSVNDKWNPIIDTLATDITDTDGNVIGTISGNLRFSFTSNGSNEISLNTGTASIDNNTGILIYTKKPDFFGMDSVQYTIENINFPESRPRVDSAWVYIFVGNKDINEDKSFLIPNAFSPNGDGINDYFRISGIEEVGVFSATKSSLEVFNRWGTLVYRSKSDIYGEDGEWWDGSLLHLIWFP